MARESKYSPEEARKPGELAQTGPVYRGVDDHNKYHPQADKVQSDPGMFGPKFPVESANK